MATFIDVSGLAAFSKIFVFVIAFIGAFVVFHNSHWFKAHQWMAWIVALAAALLFIISDIVTGLITHITPWLAVIGFFVIFVSIAGQIFGSENLGLQQTKGIFLVVLVLAVVVGSLFYIRGQIKAPGDQDADGEEVSDQQYLTTTNFIFHPKFMGIMFVLLVAIFTVALMAGGPMVGGGGGGHH